VETTIGMKIAKSTTLTWMVMAQRNLLSGHYNIMVMTLCGRIMTVSCTFPEQFAIGGSGGAGNSCSGDNSRGGECKLFPGGECI